MLAPCGEYKAGRGRAGAILQLLLHLPPAQAVSLRGLAVRTAPALPGRQPAVNNEHLPAHPAARAAQSLLHPFPWCPALGRHTGAGHTQGESWDRGFQDKPSHICAGTASPPIGHGSNWAQGSWSGTLGTGIPERGIHKLFPKAVFSFTFRAVLSL